MSIYYIDRDGNLQFRTRASTKAFIFAVIILILAILIRLTIK
jgi:hypothetical protein